jgi:hypothetical protein
MSGIGTKTDYMQLKRDQHRFKCRRGSSAGGNAPIADQYHRLAAPS